MKKLIPFVIFLLILASCAKKVPASFDNINLTIKDNWDRIYSLQMSKDGNTATSVDDPRASKKDYSFLINKEILDSIFKVTSRVDLAKLDTGYSDTCKLCVGYNIEIQKDGKTFETRVKNISTNPKIENLDKLVTLLYNVIRTTDMDPESLKRKE